MKKQQIKMIDRL